MSKKHSHSGRSGDKEKGSGKSSSGTSSSGRASASSLTDAVVAALAQVEKQSEPPKSDGADRKDEKTAVMGGAGEKPAETKPAETKPAETKPAETKPETKAEKPADPALMVVTTAAVVTVSEPSPPAAAVAPADPEITTSESSEADAEAADTVETKTPAASEAKSEPAPAPAKTEAAEPGPGIVVHYFGRTDVGLVREHNEDNFLVVDLSAQRRGVESAILHSTIGSAGAVFAVCDGMGGAAAGEVASQMAVDTIHEMLQNGGNPRDRDHFARRLVRSVEEAGSRIFAAAKLDRSRRGMGTTSTVAGLVDKTLFVGQVGDSRAYVLRRLANGEDMFALITKDQSLVNQLIEAGQLTEEEAEAFEHSNIILQALGTTEEVTVDLTFLELRRGDRLLMCSDGLSGLVHGDMIKEVMKTSKDLIDCANQLIAMANAGGGHDNITVVLADFDGQDLKLPSPGERVAYQQYPLPPEDPKDADPAPRGSTSIKSGGPKPGHDVKRSGEGPAMSASDPVGEPPQNGSRMLVAVVVAVVVLVILAVFLFGGGSGASGEAPSTHTVVSHETAAPTRPAVESAQLHVLTDAEDATLYVNGESRGPLTDGVHLTLAPGAYRIEARHGASSTIATRTVTLAPGASDIVTLNVPADDLLPPEGEPSGVVAPADPAEGAQPPPAPPAVP